MSSNTLNLIKEHKAKWVDLRFTDLKGKEHHITIPARVVDEDFFEDGQMFDGSSFAGWKGIEASDMILMPDDSTSFFDPFMQDPTVVLRCNVIEPATMQGYERDPRSVAQRAEAYLKATGLGDTAFFGPEPEFFMFDDVRWGADMSGSFCKVDSSEAAWNSGKEYQGGNNGFRPGVKGGYLPVPPSDSHHDIRATMCNTLEALGLEVEVHHHEV
ncbi:MAG: glutamine synthetase beta-grasp domain-containing protein, partial [Venatoribacter sp.]